ncbi:MAG: DUF4166 domain-containing protein [Methylobacillus sp.]|jgi:hypothetical protein|nr:DUF4166 domain-containing protein [Methylobacillus sp.]
MGEGVLYRKVLGATFDALPPRIRELHASQIERRWNGRAQVRRGDGVLAKIIGALAGLPRAADNVAVTVVFTPEQGGEKWTRDFGGKIFISEQSCDESKNQCLLKERLGMVSIFFELVGDDKQLFFIPRRWSLLGLPMPKALLPGGKSFEAEEHGQFCFNIEIRAPLAGLIVAYKGWLAQST